MENEVLRVAVGIRRRRSANKDLPDRGKLNRQERQTVTVAARVLGFSRQSFYTWRVKPVSDRQAQEAQLTAKIRLIHAEIRSLVSVYCR